MSDQLSALVAGIGVYTGLVWGIIHLSGVQSSTTLDKIRSIPTVRISDLRSLLHDGARSSSKLVFVRGVVQPKPKPRSNSIHHHKGEEICLPNPNVLHSTETAQEAVVVKRTQTCIYKEKVTKQEKKRDSDLKPTTKEETREWEETVSSTFRKVPFILAEDVRRPCSDYVIVDTSGSQHYLPLTTVYSHCCRLFHHKYSTVDLKADMLTKERILPVGKVLNAVGTCSLEKGVPVIKPCNTLPDFLTGNTKDQIMKELSDSVENARILCKFFGTVSSCIFSYIAVDFLCFMFCKIKKDK